MTQLKQTLPPSVGASRGIGTILDSCGLEVDLLEQEARQACLRLAAAEADEKGCALWEQELGLEVREDLAVEARRALIRAALDGLDTCTPEKLRVLVGNMLEGDVTLEEDFDHYTFAVKAQVERFLVPGLTPVEKALRKAAPAHLDFTLSAAADVETAVSPAHVLTAGMKLHIFTKEDIT